MTQAYSTLSTEFYDLDKPTPPPNELEFYHNQCASTNGPVLEAMSGSGRLLIPLLHKQINIEGVDFSTQMLNSCHSKCTALGLAPTLYHQNLTSLDLPKKYALIFIAVGSFQLLAKEQDAIKAIRSLKKHLLPGGKAPD